MIVVEVIETGDCAEAEDEEAALLAARTIGREARAHRGTQGFNPTLRFSVEGKFVRQITLRELDR